MKVLVFGHWSHTGFGVVTEALGSRLVAAGVDVRVLALNHRGEPVRGGLAGRVWPLSYLEQHVQNVASRAFDGSLWRTLDPGDDWVPDKVLAIADVSGLMGYMGKRAEDWGKLPVYHYCPIEGDNLPPLWRQLWDLVRPVAMSKYGQRVMSEHLGRDVPMVYHGVDTDTFHPVSPTDPIRFDGHVFRTTGDCKRWLGIDQRSRVLLRVDRNVVRKNYDALFRAFVPIAEADPDTVLVLHCQPIDGEGIDLWQEIMRMPEHLRTRVKFTNAHDTFRGLPREGLAVLYNAADLYLSTTGGEGFGLTLAESIACGVPVVTTGWAAEVEVVGEGGVVLPPLIDKYGDVVRYHSRFGMDWAVPDPAAFAEPVLRLLSKPAERRAIGKAGRAHIVKDFSWDAAASEFIDLFGEPDAADLGVAV